MITIKLTKNEVGFIERRLTGMTFYEERIKPKINKALNKRDNLKV